MTSTSQPILLPQESFFEGLFNDLSQSELECYMCNNYLIIVGGRSDSVDSYRDQEQDLITANDTSDRVLAEQRDGGTVKGVAADLTFAIAPAVNSAPSERSNNFTRLLKRIFKSGC